MSEEMQEGEVQIQSAEKLVTGMESEKNTPDAVVETKPEMKAPEKTEADQRKETELDKYWRPVKENPEDFTGWTYLLQYVEQEDNIDKARDAYNAFLSHYPYCYGYWKKFADLEKRHNDLTRAVEVFEQGVRAIPLSSELWLHYITFHRKELILEEETRKLFERAIVAAGTDFRSDKLWDNYISWERDKNLKKVTELYDRLFRIPTQLYSHHFDNFKKHVLAHHPKEILSLDEFIKLRLEVVKEQGGISAVEPGGDDVPPGDEPPPGVDADGGKGDAEESMKIKEKIMAIREAAFKQNEDEVSKRWTFEEGIKRPYFHVKPLEKSQLKNWREYLDFEMQCGVHERIVVLFERCMIAAALYEDFWLKYARYLEEHFASICTKTENEDNTSMASKMLDNIGLEAVRNVYKRACTVHLPKKPYIHMAWAAFEERHGKHSDAWRILTNLDEAIPGMVMVAMRRISLERRIGDKQKTEDLFQEYIKKATDHSVRSFYVIKYARYLHKVAGDSEKAKQTILDALEKDPKNEKLYIQLLDMEYQKYPVDVENSLEIFARAVNCEELSIHTKLKMSQRRLEFLEDFGSSILQLKECYDEHQKLLKDMPAEKKRKPDVAPIDEPLEKKVKTTGGGDQQLAADYSAYWAQYQNAAAGGYNYSAGWNNTYPQYYST